MTSDPTGTARPDSSNGLIVGSNAIRLWGMTSGERLRRCLKTTGITAVDRLPDAEARLPAYSGRVLVVPDEWVFDTILIRDLAGCRGDTLLLDRTGGVLVGAIVDAAKVPMVVATLNKAAAVWSGAVAVTPEQLSGAYNMKLRKRESPYLLRLTQDALPAIEARMFGASYKGVTDVVTKYFWPRPARAVTKVCANLKMTPNQVTFAGLMLVILSFWLFWNGHYVAGLVSGWVMTFLDTVDGKLARVTLQSSKIGDIFDHGIDLIHPPFWWWAWIVGLDAYGTPLDDANTVLGVILAGYVVQRIIEGIFSRMFGMHVHVWRRFDSQFRLWTARRNPNMLILTPAALLARPDLGIWLVAAWTALCLVIHALQLVQALAARRHGPLESWLSR